MDSQGEGCVLVHEEIPFIIGMKVSLQVITKVYKDVYKIQASAVSENKQEEYKYVILQLKETPLYNFLK